MTLEARRQAAALSPDASDRRERRHERGAEGAFGEQIPQDVWQAESDAEGVHGIAGTEKIRKNLIADETQDPAGHRRDADDPGRPYELLAFGRGRRGAPRRPRLIQVCGARARSRPFRQRSCPRDPPSPPS